MPLTAEQRAEINRENSKKSTGPKSDEGKAASRRNAVKHGLRAEALALPNEDPDVVAARTQSWNDYYQPQSPAAQHLVNTCVAATLMSDRCQTYHTAALTRQVRDAGYNWDKQRDDRVHASVALFQTDPEAAVRRLVRFSEGCRYLIERWEELLEALDARKSWTGPEIDEAVRLQGFRPELKHLKECPPAWLTVLFAHLCHENPSGVALGNLFRSDRYPELHRADVRIDSHPEPEACVRSLRRMVVEKLEPLRELEQDLLANHDEPDRDGAAGRAVILYDGPQARLFLRYHSESRTAFDRAYASLVKTLDRDAAELESDLEALSEGRPPAPADVSPNEARPDVPAPAPSEPSPPVPPNEARPAPSSRPEPAKKDASEPTQTAPSDAPRSVSPSAPAAALAQTPSPGRRVA